MIRVVVTVVFWFLFAAIGCGDDEGALEADAGAAGGEDASADALEAPSSAAGAAGGYESEVAGSSGSAGVPLAGSASSSAGVSGNAGNSAGVSGNAAGAGGASHGGAGGSSGTSAGAGGSSGASGTSGGSAAGAGGGAGAAPTQPERFCKILPGNRYAGQVLGCTDDYSRSAFKFLVLRWKRAGTTNTTTGCSHYPADLCPTGAECKADDTREGEATQVGVCL